MTDYLQTLDQWYEQERAAGRVLDIKFFPGTDRDATLSDAAKTVYESVTTSDEIDITNETL